VIHSEPATSLDVAVTTNVHQTKHALTLNAKDHAKIEIHVHRLIQSVEMTIIKPLVAAYLVLLEIHTFRVTQNLNQSAL